MTTVHAYTGDESLVDSLHKDPRRSRGGGDQHRADDYWRGPRHRFGASQCGRNAGRLRLQVPVPDASITDLVANLRETPTVTEIKDAYRAAAESGHFLAAARVLGRSSRLFRHPWVSPPASSTPISPWPTVTW